DIRLHKEMHWEFERAQNGNVALTGEFNLEKNNGNSFIVALGFGRNPDEAGQRARASILEGFESSKAQFIYEWEGWQKKLKVSGKSQISSLPKYFSISAAML